MDVAQNDRLAVEFLGFTLEECAKIRKAGLGKSIDDRIEKLIKQREIDEAKLNAASEDAIQSCVKWCVDYLRELRELHGWSQAELAARVGMKRTHVSDFEANRNDPRWSRLLLLSTALQMPLSEMFAYAPHPTTGVAPAMTIKQFNDAVGILQLEDEILTAIVKSYRQNALVRNRLSRVVHAGEVIKDLEVGSWITKRLVEFCTD